MVFVTFAFFIATIVIGGAQVVQGETLPGSALILSGVFAYWAGAALKLAVLAPVSRPRTVGFSLAGAFALIALAATWFGETRFDAYGQEMPGIAWVLAGLIAGILGTKRRVYPAPDAPQV